MEQQQTGSKAYLFSIVMVAVLGGLLFGYDTAVISGADAVMIARGGVGNPFLVTQVDRYFRTGERLPNPTVRQQAEWCIQLMESLSRNMDEETLVRKMRCYAPKFIAGCHSCREHRLKLATMTDGRESLIRMLDSIVEEMGDVRNGNR